MKKIGLLSLALVLALGGLGAGFAYWTETLEIGQNPVTMGEMKVKFTDFWVSQVQPDGQGIVTGSATKIDDQTYSLTMSNLFPGKTAITAGAFKFIFNIKNTGTIPVRITDLVITKTGGDQEVWDNLLYQYQAKHYSSAGSWTGWLQNNSGGPPTTDSWDIDLGALSDRVLLPGERMSFGESDEDESWWFAIRSSAGNIVEGKTVSLVMTFTASQFNAP